MLANVVALVFVLAIVFLHSMYGFYSGLISVFCTIVAMAIAFGYFESLNDMLTGQFELHPVYTEPLTLALLFGVTLLILRTLSDRFLRGNVRVPMYIDWAGGAVCGFVVGQIAVGIMILAFFLLPWGERAMGFAGFERDPENTTYRNATGIPPEERRQDDRVVFRRETFWLGQDRFTVGLFKMLSGGSLRGETRFASTYPDFAQWVYYTGNTVQPESFTAPARDKQGDGFKSGIAVEKWWRHPGKLSEEGTRYRPARPTPQNPDPAYVATAFEPRPGHALLAVRLQLKRASADRGAHSSAVHRFRPSMIRLVGDLVYGDGSREPVQYFPQVIGGAAETLGTNLRIVELDANLSLGEEARIDAYFEVPEAERFEPRFVEYRRHARAPVSSASMVEKPPFDRLVAGADASTSGGAAGADRETGASRFIESVNRSFSGDLDRAPFPLKVADLRTTPGIELDGNKLRAGHIAGDRGRYLAEGVPDSQTVQEFAIPEGKRLFQLRVSARSMKSLPGQIMNFVGSIANQYYVYDKLGTEYPLCGYYASVQKSGQAYFELKYVPDDLSYRQMLDFRESTVRRYLSEQDDAELALFFVVPAGSEIVAVKSQGGRVEFGETFRMGQ